MNKKMFDSYYEYLLNDEFYTDENIYWFINSLNAEYLTIYSKTKSYDIAYEYTASMFILCHLMRIKEELLEENKQLKEKYLNAVSDYEQEKSKNNKAIEILNSMKHVENFFKMGGCEKTNVDNLLEVLKGEQNE